MANGDKSQTRFFTHAECDFIISFLLNVWITIMENNLEGIILNGAQAACSADQVAFSFHFHFFLCSLVMYILDP